MSRRLDPSPLDADYVHLRVLAAQLRAQAARALAGSTGLSLLDVGCGDKPYEPLFAHAVSEHVGLDVEDGPEVDVIGTADELPLDAASFDVVLCTQAIQYADDPLGALRELRRVLRPGGVAFVSVPGASPVDGPRDRWRFTHHGLLEAMRASGEWRSVEVSPNAGAGSALAWLAGWELQGVRARTGLRTGPAVFGLVLAGWTLDRVMRRVLPGRVPDFAQNYLAVAVAS